MIKLYQKKKSKKAGKKLTGNGKYSRVLRSIACFSIDVALTWTFYMALHQFLLSDFFTLKQVIVSGNERFEKTTIVRLAGIRQGENILCIDLKEKIKIWTTLSTLSSSPLQKRIHLSHISLFSRLPNI